jgi:hypothetical protein
VKVNNMNNVVVTNTHMYHIVSHVVNQLIFVINMDTQFEDLDCQVVVHIDSTENKGLSYWTHESL